MDVRGYLLPYQVKWIEDQSGLRIMEKSRQIGMTTADALDSVFKAVAEDLALDVWVSSRDLGTARDYLRKCKQWAEYLEEVAIERWEVVDETKDLGAFTLRFASGRCIYSLSSSPDAWVGKTGHIKLDEFAVHRNQRELYALAKPCTTWGGQLSILSTQRGDQTVFYEILQGIKHNGNPMGWSHHRVTLQDAVEAGLVQKINKVSGREESREEFVRRVRLERNMKSNLIIPGEAGNRAELETVRHRMMVRARHRARGGRWWWQEGRKTVRHENNGPRTTDN